MKNVIIALSLLTAASSAFADGVVVALKCPVSGQVTADVGEETIISASGKTYNQTHETRRFTNKTGHLVTVQGASRENHPNEWAAIFIGDFEATGQIGYLSSSTKTLQNCIITDMQDY